MMLSCIFYITSAISIYIALGHLMLNSKIFRFIGIDNSKFHNRIDRIAGRISNLGYDEKLTDRIISIIALESVLLWPLSLRDKR